MNICQCTDNNGKFNNKTSLLMPNIKRIKLKCCNIWEAIKWFAMNNNCNGYTHDICEWWGSWLNIRISNLNRQTLHLHIRGAAEKKIDRRMNWNAPTIEAHIKSNRNYQPQCLWQQWSSVHNVEILTFRNSKKDLKENRYQFNSKWIPLNPK